MHETGRRDENPRRKRELLPELLKERRDFRNHVCEKKSHDGDTDHGHGDRVGQRDLDLSPERFFQLELDRRLFENLNERSALLPRLDHPDETFPEGADFSEGGAEALAPFDGFEKRGKGPGHVPLGRLFGEDLQRVRERQAGAKIRGQRPAEHGLTLQRERLELRGFSARAQRYVDDDKPLFRKAFDDLDGRGSLDDAAL